MAVVETGILVVGGLFALFKAVSDGISNWRKEDTKREKLAINTKQIEQAQKNTEQLQKNFDEIKKDRDELAKKINKGNEEVKKIQTKLRDPNLDENERKKLNDQLANLLNQQEEDKKELSNLDEQLKQIQENIQNQQNFIKKANENLMKSGFELQNFLNIETAITVGVLYIGYRLLKD